MIRRESEMDVEVREAMRGGKGRAEIMHVFAREELRGRCRLLAKITLEPGCSIGLHDHLDEEEVFYIVRGRGRIIDDGVASDISAGDAVLTGGGKSHAIENTGDECLQFLAIILLF